MSSSPVAVYCGASIGKHQAFTAAAVSLGRALASAKRPLIYGGGWSGIMGVVSSTVLEEGGKVVGIIPNAMVAGGNDAYLDEGGKEKLLETIIVDSMHERKVEMAKRAGGFIGLSGGFGTFEEVLEATTWTQLGIHDKPVVLLNVLKFWEPLRIMIEASIDAGFIGQVHRRLIIFVDGPTALEEHEFFDWGNAGLDALNCWEYGHTEPLFDWSKTLKNHPRKKEWDGNMDAI
ncbi:hypothetical protein BYT27DRAFT_7178123 [Phlegmacium glaucopus]|nr:hypothetical protein BYT27DRAFT_7178123 [Phlegmacium glaucopus]